MTFLDFLSPVLRRPFRWILTFFLIGGILLSIYLLLPPIEKYTLFFTVKPVAAAKKSFLNDGVESAEKIAEMIAGWAKDPNFQQAVVRDSGVPISGLKRKMSARKQNRLNVFWTVKLSGKERVNSEKILTAIKNILLQEIEETNKDSVVPIKITDPNVAAEPLEIPFSWAIIAIVLLSIGFSTIFYYFKESLTGRVSFLEQITEIFPLSAMLRVNSKIVKHDTRLIHDFMETFEAPHLISTFPVAGKYFEITSLSDCMQAKGTPILLVNLGKTTLRELHNLKAIFGDTVGIIVFEK